MRVKIVIAIDAFKESVTSLQAGEAVRSGVLAVMPEANVDVFPLADGGEGTVGYSRPQTPEEKEKRRESNKQFFINNPEAREKARERAMELWKDEEYRKKVTENNKKFYQEHPDMFKGENNPMYGKKHTEEALEKIRQHAATRKTKIAQLDKNTLEVIQIFDGIKDAEKALQISHGWLSKAARNNKVAYGYRGKIL